VTADQVVRSPDPHGNGSPPQPVYQAVEDWVTGHFLAMFRRPLGGEYRWCAQWWQHAEAITRLTALWHSWEVLRLQPGTGMAIWLRDHLDHQLPILLGRGGPFAACSEEEHFEFRDAKTMLAPPGWWDTSGEPEAETPPTETPTGPGDAEESEPE
jgi:hypothetical protein